MSKLSRILCMSLIIATLSLSTVHTASAQPSVALHGRNISLSFSALGILGVPMDWWLVVANGAPIYYFYNLMWQTAPDVSSLQPALQADAVDFSNIEIELPTAITTGDTGTVYFGVDFTQNNLLDLGSLVVGVEDYQF